MKSFKSICVYCASSTGNDPKFIAMAQTLGRTLAEQGITLVYGGASVGLMGEVADAALAAGGNVIGVMPQQLVNKELAHTRLTTLHVVPSMHARKQMMADLADGFIALPGGFGTFEEMFEILTWGQLGLHQKPVGLLDVSGYYTHLVQFLDGCVARGLLRQQNRDMLLHGDAPGTLLAHMREYEGKQVAKWVTHDAV